MTSIMPPNLGSFFPEFEEKKPPAATRKPQHRRYAAAQVQLVEHSAEVEALQAKIKDEAKSRQLPLDLGNSGRHHDGVDGIWGNKTFKAVQNLLPLAQPDLLHNPQFVKSLQKQLIADAQQHKHKIDLGHSGTDGDGADGIFGTKTALTLMALPPARRAELIARVVLPNPALSMPQHHGTDARRSPIATRKHEPRLGRDPASSGFTNSDQEAAFASRDASGKLIAGNNITTTVHTASLAKVATLWSALDQIQAAGLSVKDFVAKNKANITNMTSYTDPDNYNESAVKVAHAAAKALKITDAEFLKRMNERVTKITVGQERMQDKTVIDSVKGGGSTSSVRDLSLLMLKAKSDFPEVFANTNHFRPETFNSGADSVFDKAGQLKHLRTSVSARKNGGTIAVAVDDRSSQKLSTVQLDARLQAGIKKATKALDRKPAPASSTDLSATHGPS